MDELQSTKAKLLSLKEHVIDVTSRMIGALEEAPDTAAINDADDDDTPFTLVANSKRGRQLLRQQNARARQTVPQSPPRRPGIPAPTQGQPIPVVCGMTGPVKTVVRDCGNRHVNNARFWCQAQRPRVRRHLLFLPWLHDSRDPQPHW